MFTGIIQVKIAGNDREPHFEADRVCRMTSLQPTEKLHESLGLDVAAVRRMAEDRHIRPKMILNDEPYHNPTDFLDALSLLRGSSAREIAPEGLLHPVSGPPKANKTNCFAPIGIRTRLNGKLKRSKKRKSKFKSLVVSVIAIGFRLTLECA